MKGKRIIVGVCGSIAAYKSAQLVRGLISQGAEVRVLMTPAAAAFIAPLTLSTLSRNDVLTDVSSADGWNNHVELGLWADAIVIAPCTATTLSKIATGNCDNILTAVYLSARCPVFFAPAMDLDMWLHPATTRNVQQLEADGCHLIAPEHGELASGLIGQGRMAEPDNIIVFLQNYFIKKDTPQTLAGVRCLLTSGPTYEAIDPVRYIGNRSSGKMGAAIALSLAQRGALVTLVSGPTALEIIHHNITTINVESGAQMFAACQAHFAAAEICVWAAAVADYKPEHIANEKIKKNTDSLTLNLVKTTDIAATLGAQKRAGQLLIGFALETNDALHYAKLKLAKKNLDAVILNTTQDVGATFGYDTNKITIIDRTGNETDFELKAKTEVAEDIVNAIVRLRETNIIV